MFKFRTLHHEQHIVKFSVRSRKLIANFVKIIASAGWIDVSWDSGGSNSYRMGAEGKYDLQLAPSHDAEKLKPLPKPEQVATGPVKVKSGATGTDKSKVGRSTW